MDPDGQRWSPVDPTYIPIFGVIWTLYDLGEGGKAMLPTVGIVGSRSLSVGAGDPPNPFMKKVNNAKDEARQKLNNASPDCLKLLKQIGVSAQGLKGIIDDSLYEIGTISKDNLWNVMDGPVPDTDSGTTVGDLFLLGSPPWPSNTQIDGLSAPPTAINPMGMIYLRPTAVTWENVAHEAVHQLGGPQASDRWLLASLAQLYGPDPAKGGIDVYGLSSQISDKIKEKCK